MADIQLVGSGTGATTSTGVSVPLNTGTLVGDRQYCFLSVATGGSAVATEAGWEKLYDAVNDTRQYVFRRKITGTSGTSTFTWGSSQLFSMTSMTIRGDSPDGVLDVPVTGFLASSSTSYAAPSVDTTVAGAWLIRVVFTTNTSTASTATVTGPTESGGNLFWRPITTSGYPSMRSRETRLQPGATGTRDYSTTGPSTTWRGVHLVLKPAGPIFVDLGRVDVEAPLFAPTLEHAAAPALIDVAVEPLLADAIQADVDPAPVDVVTEPLPVVTTSSGGLDAVELVVTFLDVVPERVIHVERIEDAVELPGLTLQKHIDLGDTTGTLYPLESLYPSVSQYPSSDVGSVRISLGLEADPVPVRVERVLHLSPIPVEIEFVAPSLGLFDFDAIGVTVELLPVVVGLAADVTSAQRGSQILPLGEGTRVIAQSILTGEWLHWDLPVDNLKVTNVLSGPTVIAGVFKPWVEDLEDLGIDRWATWIHVEDDDIIRASGILMSGDEDPNTGQVTFEALGVTAYPHEAWFEGIYSRIGVDPADIVRYLWQLFQAAPDRNLGVTVTGTTPVRLGTEPVEEVEFETGAGERVSFDKGGPYSLSWWDNVNIGAEIDDLAKETPFDYIERPVWNATRTAVVQRVEIGYPRLGTRQRELSFSPDANVLATTEVVEAQGAYASQVIVLGAGEGRDMIRGYAGTRIGARIGRQIVVVNDKIDTKTRADARAREELARANAARFTLEQIEVDARHENAPWGSYQVGDDIHVGPLDLPHNRTVHLWCRLITATYARGSDSVLLELIPTEATNYTGAATG